MRKPYRRKLPSRAHPGQLRHLDDALIDNLPISIPVTSTNPSQWYGAYTAALSQESCGLSAFEHHQGAFANLCRNSRPLKSRPVPSGPRTRRISPSSSVSSRLSSASSAPRRLLEDLLPSSPRCAFKPSHTPPPSYQCPRIYKPTTYSKSQLLRYPKRSMLCEVA